jgi:hypothetical protein
VNGAVEGRQGPFFEPQFFFCEGGKGPLAQTASGGVPVPIQFDCEVVAVDIDGDE